MNSSFRIARIFGINVDINPSWLLVFFLFSFTLSTHYFPGMIEGFDTAVYWSMGIITTLLIFASILLHELAHSLMAIRSGIPIKKITLFIFGGVAQMEKEPDKPGVELKIALVGPATSLALALLAWLIYQPLPPDLAISSMLWFLARINFVVGVINLIPAFPLDGGRVLRAGLWHFMKSMLRATRAAVALGSVFAFLAIGLGFLLLFQMYWVWGLWYIFLGWMLYQAGQASYTQLVFQQAFKGVTVSRVMSSEVQTVEPDLTLDQLVEKFYRYKFGAFPVTYGGRLRGLVSYHQIREISQEKWSETKTSQVMTPADQLAIASPHQEAVEVMMKMAAGNLGRVLVVENGELVGILSRTDMMKLINLHMQLGTEK